MRCFFLGFLGLLASSATAQLNITSAIPAQQLVQNDLLGTGVQISNVTTSGHPRQFGRFTNANSNLPLNSGILLSTGYADDLNNVNTNLDQGFTSNHPNPPANCMGGICEEGDDDLNFMLGDTISRDAAVLEFDFIPEADTVRFRYVFASEEYNEYVCSQFNDIFAFLVTGPGLTNYNVARVPNSNFPVAINTVNNGQPGIAGSSGNCSAPFGSLNFSQYFIDNVNGSFVQFDGMTVALEAVIPVRPCETYHIKLAVADVGDAQFDSGVFLEMGSFSSNELDAFAITLDTALAEGCQDGTVTFQLGNPYFYDLVIPCTISGTATNGADYTGVPDTLVIPAGLTTASFTVTALADSMVEGVETVVIYYKSTPCTAEYDSLIINISEEVILPAPDSLFCASFTNTVINFGWTPVPGATGYEVSRDTALGWFPAAPGPLQHNANRATPNEAITLYVRAIGGTTGCSENPMDSIVCYTCGIEVELDSVAHLPCDGSANGAIALTVSGGNAPYSFLWSNGFADEDLTGLSTGIYNVTISDAFDCRAYAGANIQASYPPNVDAYIFQTGVTSYSMALGDEVLAGVDPDLSGNGVVYTWTPLNDPAQAGLLDALGTPVRIQPTENGVYTYRVVGVSNTFGTICVDSADVQLTVTGFLGIPTAFTPNGDGDNDRFRPVHLSKVELLEFRVYNRFGELVYSDPDLSDGGWDGFFRGQPQARDTYLYVIRFQQAGSSEETVMRGEVTLLR